MYMCTFIRRRTTVVMLRCSALKGFEAHLECTMSSIVLGYDVAVMFLAVLWSCWTEDMIQKVMFGG